MITTMDFLQILDVKEGEIVNKIDNLEGYTTSQLCAETERCLVHDLRCEIIRTMDAKEFEEYEYARKKNGKPD